jgi:two-component system, NtrC family, sensor kinase
MPGVMSSNDAPVQDRLPWHASLDNTGIDPIPISQKEWEQIEALSDLLAEHANMQTALSAALNFLSIAFQRSTVIFFVQSPTDPAPILTVSQNLTEPLASQLSDANSELRRVSNKVLDSGRPTGAVASLNLAAAIPVGSRNERQGILLFCGKAFGDAELQSLQRLVRPVSRMIKANRSYLEVSRWQLLRSRNTLRALFDNIPASVYIIDQKYYLIALNLTRATLASNKPNVLVGRQCYEALYGRDQVCLGCRVAETLRTGENTNRTGKQWAKDGEQMEWEISTYPIRDETSEVIQAILFEQDVTEKRRLEATLMQSEKLAAVGQLAAGVAHEINNPLTAIIANAQMLQRELPAQDDRQELVELIAEAGSRATQVVRNLLDFARKEQYEFTPTNLNENIRRALALMQHEIVSRPIRLSFEPTPDLPFILASQDHLQGVWLNLVMNAIDAIEDGEGEIHIFTRQAGDEVRVSVIDTGKGIPSERLSRIFEPFYTTKAPGRGTGLGLSLCHRIVKLHGGQILVSSQVGKGTEFIVTLPIPADGVHPTSQGFTQHEQE